jgi:hypothetical protein
MNFGLIENLSALPPGMRHNEYAQLYESYGTPEISEAFCEVVDLPAERVLSSSDRAMYRLGDQSLPVEDFVCAHYDGRFTFVDTRTYQDAFMLILAGIVDARMELRSRIQSELRSLLKLSISAYNELFRSIGKTDSPNYITNDRHRNLLSLIDTIGSGDFVKLFMLYIARYGRGYPDLIEPGSSIEVKSEHDHLSAHQLRMNRFFRDELGWQTVLVSVLDINKETAEYRCFMEDRRTQRKTVSAHNRVFHQLFTWPNSVTALGASDSYETVTDHGQLEDDVSVYVDFIEHTLPQYAPTNLLPDMQHRLKKVVDDLVEDREEAKLALARQAIQAQAEPLLERYRRALDKFNAGNRIPGSESHADALITLLAETKSDLHFWLEHYPTVLMVIADKLSLYYKKLGQRDCCRDLIEWYLSLDPALSGIDTADNQRILSRARWSGVSNVDQST